MAFLRKEGRYWKVYFYFDGKLHKRSTRTQSKPYAEQIRRKIEDEIAGQKFNLDLIDRKGITLFQFLDDALKYSRNNKSKSTYKIDELFYKQFKEHTGNIYLNRIDIQRIEQYKDCLLNDLKLKPTGINMRLRHLSSAFSLAVKYKHIQRNPFNDVKKVPVPNKLPAFLSKDQADNLLKHTQGKMIHQYIMIALYTGARSGEICNLKWSDVDLETKHIRLYGKGNKERRIPIPDTLQKYLADRVQKHGYVVTGTRDIKVVTRYFRRYADKKEINLRNFRFHDLRHTYASWLAQAGRSIQEIKELLGHTSIHTTMRYAHLIPSNLSSAVSVLDRKPKPKMELYTDTNTTTKNKGMSKTS